MKKSLQLYSSSDNQPSYRRQATDRRDYENTLLFNYDPTIYHPHTKYGTSSLL